MLSKQIDPAITQSLEKRIPMLSTLFVLVTLLAIPWRIIVYGYMPRDDASRHAAKAIAQKPWDEILVLNPSITIDQHDGWHHLLGWLHNSFGLNADTLVLFAVIFLSSIIFLSGLALHKRAECWLITLLIIQLVNPVAINRWMLGRPFLLSIAVTILLMALWNKVDKERPQTWKLVLSVLLVALGVWMHGSWYLYVLPIAAFVLAGKLHAGFRLGGCILLGILLGALCTGTPGPFLGEQLLHMLLSLGEYVPQHMLVTEFRPSNGEGPILLAGAIVALATYAAGQWKKELLHQPVFMLAAIGWLLGFNVFRFWFDWGLNGYMLWLSGLLFLVFHSHLPEKSLHRLATTAFLCLAAFFCFTNDYGSKWSGAVNTPSYDWHTDSPGRSWIPEPGGILYSASMQDFYRLFYTFPEGDWKYSTGFEPGIMEQENREIYRRIQWNKKDYRAYQPWVDKMKPADRLFMNGPEHAAPPINELEWKYAGNSLWIGRPPENSPEQPSQNNMD